MKWSPAIQQTGNQTQERNKVIFKVMKNLPGKQLCSSPKLLIVQARSEE